MRKNVSNESQKKILGLFNMIGLLVLIIRVRFGRRMKILKHSCHIYPTLAICYRYSIKNLLLITLLQFTVIPHKIFWKK